MNCLDTEMEIGFSNPVKSTRHFGLVCFALFACSRLLLLRADQDRRTLAQRGAGRGRAISAKSATRRSQRTHDRRKPVTRLGNVSKPTVRIYRPPADKNAGAAVLVFPGGGYHILAMDLEGTEVCDWLNSIGVTGVLLKYRVPKREGLEKHAAPLQRRQRALGLVREHCEGLGIDPQRIGVLGFSAGGHLAAALSKNYGDRTYPGMDDADQSELPSGFSNFDLPRRPHKEGRR